MTINQLRYVLEISKSNSMREASNRLFVSQPALTASIHDLEEELGKTLFIRTNKGVSLTRDGEEFLVYAKKAISQFDILEDRFISSYRDKKRFSVSTQHFNFSIQAFAKVIQDNECDSYAYAIHETKTLEVIEHVSNMISEIGIVSYVGNSEQVIKKILKDEQLEFVPLMKRDTYAYFWKGHPMAEREKVSLKELSEYPCISFEQSSRKDYYLSEEALADYNFPKVIKSDDRATSMELIEKLNGYSIGSGMLSEEDAVLQGLVAVKLVEEDPLTIGYIKRKNQNLSELAQQYEKELLYYKE